MEEDDKGCPMIRMGASGWMFLLVPAYPGSPGQKAVKRLCVCVCVRACVRACVHCHVYIQNKSWQVPLLLLNSKQCNKTRLCKSQQSAYRKQEAQLLPWDHATHRASWNRAKCCTNVHQIAFDKSRNRRVTFKVKQGHWKWYKSIGHMILPIRGE